MKAPTNVSNALRTTKTDKTKGSEHQPTYPNACEQQKNGSLFILRILQILQILLLFGSSSRWFNRVWGDRVPLFGRTHVVSAYVFSIDIKDLTVLCRNRDFSTQFEDGANGLTHALANAHSIRSIRTCRKKSRIASINGVVGKRRKIGAPRSPLRTHRHD